ncbi:MAG: hypothetical protein HG454_002610 [Clostridiales bacterium]|nr:hypothetical protein [Clostridiales bacterium]
MVEQDNNKIGKIIMWVILLILVVLTVYLFNELNNKNKVILEKEKIIQQQKEISSKILKEKDKKQDQPKEEKELSKEEYLKIFKELVGIDFPGDHNTRANDKKIEIIENPKEGLYPNSKYTIRKSGMLKQASSGIAEGEYNILTKEEVKKLLYDFAKKMGYSNVTEYKDNYEMSEKGFKNGIPHDLSVELEAKNSKNGILRLAILFLRDKDNKVTNKVYSAYVGIY